MTAARLLVGLLLAATVAGAYDSVCYLPDGTPCQHGPVAARNRWVGLSDEHRELWELSRSFAGLPAAVGEPFTLDVFAGNATVTADGDFPAGVTSLEPVAFAETQERLERTMTIGEFAQLPDHAYALWDWVRGHETCPPGAAVAATGPTTAKKCHEFQTHMGQVNANHFLPQAGHFYAHYHGLALARGAACKTMRDRIVARGGNPADFDRFLRACEQGALLLEAIGHHFLQDAWSTGHMWERWGSPDLGDFPSPLHAQIVAMTTGLIHGARGLLEDPANLVSGGTIEVNDALCAPHLGVRWRGPDHPEPQPGVGDLYLDDLLNQSVNPVPVGEPASLATQHHRLFSCAVAGILQVYDAAGAQHGPAAPQTTAFPLESVDPTSAACFGQRATNLALRRAAGIDLATGVGSGSPTQLHIDLDSWLVTLVVVGGASAVVPLIVDPLDPLGVQYRLGLVELIDTIDAAVDADPFGTQLASGVIGPMIGVAPNGAYVKTPLAPYVDPALAPALPAGGPDAERATWIARAFHRAHAADWCARFAPGAPDDLQDLRAHAGTLAQSNPTGEAAEAACTACTEFARRALRRGSGPSDFDPNDPPLCYLVAENPDAVQYAYQGGQGAPEALAAWWCRCPTQVDVEASLDSLEAGEPASLTVRVRVTDEDGHVAWPAGAYVDVDADGATGGAGQTNADGVFETTITADQGVEEVVLDVVARAEPGGSPLAEMTLEASVGTPGPCDYRPRGVYATTRGSYVYGNAVTYYFPAGSPSEKAIHVREDNRLLRERTDLPGAPEFTYFGPWMVGLSNGGNGSRDGISGSGSFHGTQTSEVQAESTTIELADGSSEPAVLFEGFTFAATAKTSMTHVNSGPLRARTSAYVASGLVVEFTVVEDAASFTLDVEDVGPGLYLQLRGGGCGDDDEEVELEYDSSTAGDPYGTPPPWSGMLPPGSYEFVLALDAHSGKQTNVPPGEEDDYDPAAKDRAISMTFTVTQ